jgi:hypothetical protein
VSALPQLDDLEARVGDHLGGLIEGTRRKLTELQRKREELDKEISAYARKLRAYEGFQRSLDPQAPHLRLVGGDTPPTKREAVLGFLSEDPEGHFKLIEIRRGLLERGWMSSDKRSIHALEVAVIEMERRGEIRRVRKGVYTLRPRAEDEWTDPGIGVQTR